MQQIDLRKWLMLSCLLLCFIPLRAQTLSGQFVYQDNQEPVPGVEVSLPAFGIQTISNAEGFFGLLLPDTANLEKSYRISVQVPGSIALAFMIKPDNMAVIPLARIDLPTIEENLISEVPKQNEEPPDHGAETEAEDTQNEPENPSQTLTDSSRALETNPGTKPQASDTRTIPSKVSKQYAQINQTLDRVGNRLTQERQRMIKRNQTVKDDIIALYKVIQQESQKDPRLGDQKELLIKKLAKLEQELQENSNLYATLYEETQAELNRVKDVLSGGQDIFITNLFYRKVIYTLI